LWRNLHCAMASLLTTTRRLPRVVLGITMLVIALASSSPEPAAAAPAYCGPSQAGPGVDAESAMESETLRRLNVIRRAHRLKPLRANTHLRAAALAHARDMLRRRYFSHDGWSHDIASSGYLAGHGSWSVGQNIAWGRYQCGAPQGIVYTWMHSPPHRKVILTARFKDVGIAVLNGAPLPVDGPAATYVADFGVLR
jgi:uncharacterized protein YkwD